MSIAPAERETPRALTIAAAAGVTILDGFDAFSLSLMAPRLRAEFSFDASVLGAIFAAAMGGMIIGALAGGALADRYGRVRMLMVALALFGFSALAMTVATNAYEMIANRLVAGVGLGAAAPIAIGLLSRSTVKPPSELLLSAVWSGIPVGGILAALFSYFIVPDQGWRSIFIAGGVIPLLVAVSAYVVFRRDRQRSGQQACGRRSGILAIFADGAAYVTILTALMFFFGYVTTSIITSWLPTVLGQRSATPLMIALTFSGINLGGVMATLALGLLTKRAQSRRILVGAWATVGCCGLVAGLTAVDSIDLALLAVAGASLGAGAQCLSVAIAAQLHRARGLETTSVGFMTAAGRIGQFSALSLISYLFAAGMAENGLFIIAGASACGAAGFAVLLSLLNSTARESA